MKTKTILLAMVLAMSTAHAEFAPTMTQAQAKVEIQRQLANRVEPRSIMAAALLVNLDVVQLLLNEGVDVSALYGPTAAGNTQPTAPMTFSASRASSVGGGGRSSVSPN